MDVGILIGYFAKKDAVRKALRELAGQDFHRAALLHKDADGDVHISDPFLWFRALRATLAACLSGGIAGLAVLFLPWFHSVAIWGISISQFIFACAALGGLTALLWLRRSKYGIKATVLHDHGRWLLPGESALILQASIASLH